MGVYYYYVNETNEQYFCIDPSGTDIKKYALGDNIGSRALHYLLLNNDEYFTGVPAHSMVGSWIGTHFFVTGDDYDERFKDFQEKFENIGQSVVEMIVEIAPYDLVTHGGVEWLLTVLQYNGKFITIDPKMRKRMSKAFRQSNHLQPDEELQKVITELKALHERDYEPFFDD
ncbi:MAG: hypothetical protein HUJ26_10165 [Planctomycetaceae bacterium]|nr:hypothetical protein [Planctomycetaceae bacterium]